MERDFGEKLQEVESIVSQGKKHLLSHMWLVDRDALIDAIQVLRAAVPAAIQDANNINASRSRILGDAKRFSDNTLAEATARARSLQQESEARASQVVAETEARVAQMQQEAEASARKMMEDAERRAAVLVSQDEIVRRSEVRAREINEEAVQRSNTVYHDALNKAEDLLAGAEQLLAERANEMRRYRAEIGQY